MHDTVKFGSTSPTAHTIALVSALGAAALPGAAAWPVHAPQAYVLTHHKPSFSELAISVPTIAIADPAVAFAQALGEIYAKLTESQEPLGSEFEAVWDANTHLLFEQ